LRAVLDTNIFISGIIWRGSPYQCLQAAEAGMYELAISEPILRELEAVLIGKFRFTNAKVESSIKLILEIGRRVEISERCQVIKNDPDDDKFIETAIAGEAAFIVSGDRHLLRLNEFKGVRILTPGEFIRIVFEE
jgi:putative PIN family toxin of toxin-antitoxin system